MFSEVIRYRSIERETNAGCAAKPLAAIFPGRCFSTKGRGNANARRNRNFDTAKRAKDESAAIVMGLKFVAGPRVQ